MTAQEPTVFLSQGYFSYILFVCKSVVIKYNPSIFLSMLYYFKVWFKDSQNGS